VTATDQGDYFKVPLDARSLQYELYYEQGESTAAELEDYTSENTQRMDVEQTKQLLLKLPEIRSLLGTSV